MRGEMSSYNNAVLIMQESTNSTPILECSALPSIDHERRSVSRVRFCVIGELLVNFDQIC